MINVAKNGSQVLQVNGLSTASLVNPDGEGEKWAEAQDASLKVAGAGEPIVILGIGSAFHIQSVQKKLRSKGHRGRLIALDCCHESVEFANRSLVDVELLHVDTACGVDFFFARHDVASWVTQPFVLLRHKPTFQRSGQSLRFVETWLLGRTPEAFSAQLKLRPQIAAALNADRSRRLAETPLVSVRDLSKAWDISSELKTDRRLFRILEELVR